MGRKMSTKTESNERSRRRSTTMEYQPGGSFGAPRKPSGTGMKKGGKMTLPKRKPRHANPNHPMNAERTTGHPDGVTRKTRGGKVKKYDKGGKMMDAMKAKVFKDYGKSGIKKGENPRKSIEDLILEVGMEQGVFSKKKGGSVKAAKHGGSMCRGGGAATRGKNFKVT